MIKDIRKKFNSEFTEEKFNNFLNDLYGTYNYKIDFNISETPVFLTNEFKDELVKAANEIVSLTESENYKKISNQAIPANLNVPNETDTPTFMQVDFAICKDENGNFIPQLIELQAFASLFFYQILLSKKYKEHFNLDENFSSLFSGLDENSYINIMRDVIVADKDPENVVLLEIEPEKQKTLIDFLCTETYLGIKTVGISNVVKKGNKLFYPNNGKLVPIERIYNRVIFDELYSKEVNYNFSFQDDLNVEWAGHPNWFFKISKYTLPFLKSKYVPETKFLNEIKEYPSDLENYVLKPLFSFAGSGVKYEVSKELLDSIANKENYILMKKINYEPTIETLDVPAKAEIRMMFVWKDGKPLLVNNLIRMSKGKMMGVDFNKGMRWVGSSIGLYLN